MDRSGHVEERLIDRDPLDQRGEVVEHVDDQVAEPLVLGEVPADEDQVGAQPFRPPAGHRPVHPKGPGLV